MLANRLYLGEVGFRDVTTPNAHPALIDTRLFDECQQILHARGEIHSQRAASNSDYHLTGLITCPHCGNKYVGTSATGKLRRYRYYTCFARTRYGTAGCTAPRIDADLLDHAVQEALIDFYSRTDLIDAAIAAEQARRADGAHRHHAELHSISSQITTTEAAIDRYLTAFENGTLDERTCGRRVRDLTTKLDQLRTRHDELPRPHRTPASPAQPAGHPTHARPPRRRLHPRHTRPTQSGHRDTHRRHQDRREPAHPNLQDFTTHETGPTKPSTDPDQPKNLEPDS
jgi:site-specific DNA recombinase